MGDYLHANGWRVIAIGTAGAKSPPPLWEVLEAVEPPIPERHAPARFTTLCRRVLKQQGRVTREDWKVLPLLMRDALIFALGILPALAASLASAFTGLALLRVRPAWARRLLSLSRTLLNPVSTSKKVCAYGSLWLAVRSSGDAADRELVRQHPILAAMRALVLKHGQQGIWIANDWLTLPLAAEGAKTFRSVYVYDSHEFATQEFAERWDWRVFRQPLVKRVEGQYIDGARVLTAVSPPITEALVKKYSFKGVAATLRNMPVYQEFPLRPVGAEVRVLYHGILAPHRGLEAAIQALSQWPDGFRLTIRGPGHAAYLQALSALAAKHGVSRRLVIEPPLPVCDLVKAASAHDVGLLALPGHSTHNAFALPNKVYEYMMAGLSLCLSDLPAMAEVVRTTGAGVLCGDGGPSALARAMRSLTHERINSMKANALEAAKTLHFDVDAQPIAHLYLEALRQVQGAGASQGPAPLRPLRNAD